MFLLLSLCLCGLLQPGDAQNRAALWRANDPSGRCQYTFTVPSPVESSCPQTGGPELEVVKARLNVLESLVSRLTSEGDAGDSQRATAEAQAHLQESLVQAVEEKNLLHDENRRLAQEMQRLLNKMEEVKMENENLKSQPCPHQIPVVPPSPSLPGSVPMRPAGGKRHSQTEKK